MEDGEIRETWACNAEKGRIRSLGEKRERRAKMKVVIERMTVEALGSYEGGGRRCPDEESRKRFSSKFDLFVDVADRHHCFDVANGKFSAESPEYQSEPRS